MLSITPATEAAAAAIPTRPEITEYNAVHNAMRVNFVDRTDVNGYKLELYGDSNYGTVLKTSESTVAQEKSNNGLRFDNISSNTLYYLKAYTYNGSGTNKTYSQPLELAIRTKAVNYTDFVASPTMDEQRTKALVDRNLKNSLNLLSCLGTFRNDTFGYSTLTGPSSTNGTISGSGFTVNANGETASDRESKSYEHNIKFYMEAPCTEDSFTYTVNRSNRNYVFNQANNWGWGNPTTGIGGIRYIPSSQHDPYYGNYTFNAWEVDTKTLSGLHRTSYTNDGKSYNLLTYDDLSSMSSPLVSRTNGINGYLWNNADKVGLTYSFINDNGNNSKPTTGSAGFWEGAQLNWALSRIKHLHDNQREEDKSTDGEIPLDPEQILSENDAEETKGKWSVKDTTDIDNDKDYEEYKYNYGGVDLVTLAEEAIGHERQSGWVIALNEADKGTLSCTYDNVGQFKGKTVSVKLTVSDWQTSDEWRNSAFRQYSDSANYKTGNWYLNSLSESAVGNWSLRKTPGTNVTYAYDDSFAAGGPYGGGNKNETCPLLSFASDGIGVNVCFVDWIKVDYTFIDENGKEITDSDFSGRGTWKDIDFSQSVSFLPASQNNGKGFTGIYDYDGSVVFMNSEAASKANSKYNINITANKKYDSLLYKSWDFTNSNGSTDKYWGVFDWVSTNGELDNYKTNWIYAEFNGSFSIVYGANGHGDMTSVGLNDKYNTEGGIHFEYSNSGDEITSRKRLATSPVTSLSALDSGSKVITYSSIQGMRGQSDAHLVNDVTGTSYYGEITINKFVQQKNGSYVKASGSDWASRNNVFFVIKDGNGKYLAYDLSSSNSNGEYVIDDTITYNDWNGSRQSRRVTRFALNSSGVIHITNIPAGTYFIEEIFTSEEYKSLYKTPTIRCTVITGSSPSSPAESEDGKFEVYDKESTNKTTNVLVYNNLYDTGKVTFTKYAKTPNTNTRQTIKNSAATGAMEFVLMRKSENTNNNDFYTILTGSNGNYSYEKLGTPTAYPTPLRTVLKLNSSNKIVINDLPPGDYYFREITGYDKLFTGTMSDVGFTLKENSEISVSGLNTLNVGSITVNKSFESKSTPISGAKFSLTGTSDSGTNVNMTVAVTNGKAVFSNIPYGTYTLSETAVPTGYDAVADRKVTVSSTTQNVTINITDPLTKGFLKIIKENEDGSIPNGIAFNIKSVSTASGVSVDQTVIIINGSANVNLPVGRYIVTEIANSVPEDYLVADPQTVDVHDSDTFSSPATVTFVNKLAEGPITITKKLTESYYTQEEFVFEVSETEKDGTVNKFLAYIVIPAGKTSGSVTIDKCRNGRTYSVRELNTNWRYTPVNDGTYLQVNGKSPTAEHNYSKNTATNTLSFKAVALNSNDYECIFTNKGHDHWLDDGATVTNVMKPIK